MKCPVCKMNVRSVPLTEKWVAVLGSRQVRIALHGDCKGSGLVVLRKNQKRERN